MTAHEPTTGPDPSAPPRAATGDPLLSALDQAEGHYRAVLAQLEQETQDALRARAELAATRDALRQASEELRRACDEADHQRRRAARQRDRAEKLAAALKDIHRALFNGNVYELILKACVTITGAARGVYLTSWGNGQLRVRAAIDVAGYPDREPSAFLRAVCHRAGDGEGDSFRANDPQELAELPPPDAPGEKFSNLMAAPAVLLKEFNGVVVLADKPGGFDDDDEELVVSVGDQAGVAVENRRLQEELLQTYFSIVGVLADAVEAKDPYTHGHSELVARYARLTAAKLAESDEHLRSVSCYGGLLHDIGKIGVSDGVLHKPGRLLPEEWDLMRSHVRIGNDLLANVPALAEVAGVVLYHHERWDGNGYPDRLAADKIPLAARIVCVVDSYTAMTSKRSYKDSMTNEQARQELIACKGSHFDPQVVDAFLAVLDDDSPLDDCPDGFGLPPLRSGADFRHALRLDDAEK